MKKEKVPEKAYEKVNVSISKLEEVSFSLNDLSRSFYNVGNEKISDQLFELGSIVREAIGYLKLSESQIVDEGYKQAVQNTANVVAAAMAGAKIKS